MKILLLEDIATIASKESMDTVYLEFEQGGLYTYQTYGLQNNIGYCLGDKGWNPMYTSTLEDFMDKVKKNSPFQSGSILVKIKG